MRVLAAWTNLAEMGAAERGWASTDTALRLVAAVTSCRTEDVSALEVVSTTAAGAEVAAVLPSVFLPTVMGTEIFHAIGRQLLQLRPQLAEQVKEPVPGTAILSLSRRSARDPHLVACRAR